MSKKGRIIKAGLSYTIGNFFIKGLFFLTTPLFTRIMSTEDYGIVGGFMAYETIMVVLISFMLHASIKNAFIDFKNEINRYASNIMATITLITIPFLVIILIFNQQIYSLTQLGLIEQILIILTAYGLSILNVFNSVASMKYEYKRYLLIGFINSILNIALSLLLIYTLFANNKSLGRIIGYAAPIIFLAIIIIVVGFIKYPPNFSKKHLSFAFVYSTPLIMMGISEVLLSQSDRVMIKFFKGNEPLAFYSLAYSAYAIISVIRNSTELVWIPTSYNLLEKEDYESFKKYSNMYIYLFFFITASCIILAKEIVFVLGGQEYQESIYSAVPLIVASFIIMLNSLPSNILYFHKKGIIVSSISVFATIINIVLNLLLIPSYGYIFAAYTTLASIFILLIFNYLFVRFKLKIKFIDFTTILYTVSAIGIFSFIALFVDNFIIRFIILLILTIISYYIYRVPINTLIKKIFRRDNNEERNINN